MDWIRDLSIRFTANHRRLNEDGIPENVIRIEETADISPEQIFGILTPPESHDAVILKHHPNIPGFIDPNTLGITVSGGIRHTAEHSLRCQESIASPEERAQKPKKNNTFNSAHKQVGVEMVEQTKRTQTYTSVTSIADEVRPI